MVSSAQTFRWAGTTTEDGAFKVVEFGWKNVTLAFFQKGCIFIVIYTRLSHPSFYFFGGLGGSKPNQTSDKNERV